MAPERVTVEPSDDDVRVRRADGRARYDRDTVHAIVDEALVAHVGTVRDGLPVVIPMFHARVGDHLLLHGAPATGSLRRAGAAADEGFPVCVELTLLDGLVLARSAFHHSVNYRSVVMVGTAVEITDPQEKAAALEAFVERLVPGRSADLRPTTDKEARGTSVLKVSLERSSAKVRAGFPIDDDADVDLPIWGGVVPIRSEFAAPQPDGHVGTSVVAPATVAALAGTPAVGWSVGP